MKLFLRLLVFFIIVIDIILFFIILREEGLIKKLELKTQQHIAEISRIENILKVDKILSDDQFLKIDYFPYEKSFLLKDKIGGQLFVLTQNGDIKTY